MTEHDLERPWRIIEREVAALLDRIDPDQFQAFSAAFGARERRWFFAGQGRSGLVAQMVAMRAMHLGYDAHVVGAATAPAVRCGDRLLLVCGSGRTPVSVGFAQIAKAEGAELLLVTHKPETALARMADRVLVVPMEGSAQFGGTLFEQSCLILFDTICLGLGSGPDAHAAMWQRHTNMQ